MANPFTGLITTQLKTTFKYAIEELIRGLSRPCALIYGDSIQTECTNCYIDIASRKSANMYKPGGPIPFADGQICPYCNGQGLKSVTTTEIVNLAIIWNYNGSSYANMKLNYPIGTTLTLSSMDLVPKLKMCREIILDVSINGDFDVNNGDDFTDVYGYTGVDLIKEHRFIRDGEPEPAGLGSHDFAFTAWRRS